MCIFPTQAKQYIFLKMHISIYLFFALLFHFFISIFSFLFYSFFYFFFLVFSFLCFRFFPFFFLFSFFFIFFRFCRFFAFFVFSRFSFFRVFRFFYCFVDKYIYSICIFSILYYYNLIFCYFNAIFYIRPTRTPKI